MEQNFTDSETTLTTDQRLELLLGPRHRSLHYAVSITVLYSIIFLTAILGNLSTCIVIARRRYMRTATNCYLFSLAVSDMVTILVGMPPEFWTVWEQYPWPFGNVYCVMKCFLSEVTSYASILTIQLFTVERWLAVCYPMKSQIMVGLGRSVKLLVLIWIVAIVSGLPFVFYSSTIVPLSLELPANNRTDYVHLGAVAAVSDRQQLVARRSNSSSNLTDAALEHTSAAHLGAVQVPILESEICATNDSEMMWKLCVISAAVFFFIPLLIITTLYSLIGIRLRKSCKQIMVDEPARLNAPRNALSAAKPLASSSLYSIYSLQTACNSRRQSADGQACGADKQEKRSHPHTDRMAALRILVAVIVVFFVSYAPYHCQRIIGKFAEDIILNVPHGKALLDYLFYVSVLTHAQNGILYYVSATVNPLLYNMVSKRYRRAFLHTFRELLRCRWSRPEKLYYSSQIISKTSQIMGSKLSIFADAKENSDEVRAVGEDTFSATTKFTRKHRFRAIKSNFEISTASGGASHCAKNGMLRRKFLSAPKTFNRHKNTAKHSDEASSVIVPRIIIN